MNEDDNIMNEFKEELQDEFALPQHSVKHRQAERKIRKKRKKLNRLKSFLRSVLLFLLLFLIYEFVKLPQWYLSPDVFKTCDSSKIEIVNNNIVPDSVIYNSLKNIQVQKVPIFLMSVKPIKKELFKIPVFKNIYIRRYGFPARIQIILRERVPVALIKTDLKSNPVAFFTSDGVLIANKNYIGLSNSKSTLTILTTTPKLGKIWTVKKVNYIEKIVKAIETYSGEKVSYIDMRNPNDVYVRIQKTSIRLGALDSTVFERIKRIYTILPQIKDMDSQIKYIDLSWDKVNYLKLKK